jgi:hypothetical protein
MIVTPIQIRDRIMALCEMVTFPAPYTTGTAYTDESECSWAEADLPAMVIEKSGRGNEYTYSASAPREVKVRCTYRIILYMSHICDESYGKKMDNVDFAEMCQQSLILFFACRQRLELDGAPLVNSAQILRDTDPHTLATKGSVTKNRTVIFNMAVEYSNYAQ